MGEWIRNSGRTAYENPWITVVEDRVSRPDGSDGIYGVVELRFPAVFVVAIDEEDRVLLVRLDRYTVGASWEVPSGGSDGEDLGVAARRELLEETGIEAGTWEQVGTMNSLNGVCRAPGSVYVARDLVRVDAGADRESEGIGEVAALPWGDVLAMVRDGQITDNESIAALTFAGIRLGWIG